MILPSRGIVFQQLCRGHRHRCSLRRSVAISDSSCLCAVQPSSSFRGNRPCYECYAAATPTSFPLPTHQSHRHRQSNRITRKANSKDSTKGEKPDHQLRELPHMERPSRLSSSLVSACLSGSPKHSRSHTSSISGITRPTFLLPRAASCIGHITFVCCRPRRTRSCTDRCIPSGVLPFTGDRNSDMGFLYALLKERERGDRECSWLW